MNIYIINIIIQKKTNANVYYFFDYVTDMFEHDFVDEDDSLIKEIEESLSEI